MELDHNGQAERPCVLLELLRRVLALVDYYGPLETNESDLFELKLALIRTIERLDAHTAARDAAPKGAEPDYAEPLRKGPHGETVDSTRLRKNGG